MLTRLANSIANEAYAKRRAAPFVATTAPIAIRILAAKLNASHLPISAKEL